MEHPINKEILKKEFFSRIPKARPSSPLFRGFFDCMYRAHESAKPGSKVLNVYASHDFSGNRETVYKDKFFNQCDYHNLDFWEDHFMYEGKKAEEKHKIPFPDNSFDVVVATKFIMEHVSEPEMVLRELYRILKPGGELFIIATHLRRQHQPPHDYYRFTEFAVQHLWKKVGFKEIEIHPTNGAMTTFAYYLYFFQRQTPMPKFLEKFFDWLQYWTLEPFLYWLDRFDNGYGRDLSMYFWTRAKK